MGDFSARANLSRGRVRVPQVLVNLVMNAIEAMASKQESLRSLVVSTWLQQEHHVLVSVKDSGIGLDPVGSQRMFEPFFTTKSSGVGLGLSICRELSKVTADVFRRLQQSPTEPCFNLHYHIGSKVGASLEPVTRASQCRQGGPDSQPAPDRPTFDREPRMKYLILSLATFSECGSD
jgi:hypothetical protein